MKNGLRLLRSIMMYFTLNQLRVCNDIPEEEHDVARGTPKTILLLVLTCLLPGAVLGEMSVNLTLPLMKQFFTMRI